MKARVVKRRHLKRDIFLLFIGGVMATILLGGSYAAYAEYRDEAENLLSQAHGLAITISEQESISPFTDAPGEESSKQFRELEAVLRQFDLTTVGGIDNVFLFGQRPNGELFFYVGSGDADDATRVPLGLPYEEASQSLKGVFSTGEPATFIERNQWGSWLSAAAPIYAADGSVAGVLTISTVESELLLEIVYRIIVPMSAALISVAVLLIILRRIIRRQQAILYQRSVFVTTTSHDIRSPLRGILWALELMKDPKAEIGPLIATMEHQLTYVIDLVDSVLASVRTDLALAQFSKKRQNIIPLLEDVVASQKLSAAQYEVTIKTDFPKQLYARVDRELVREVASNLLSNAVKYTRPGTAVSFQAHQKRGGALIRVIDQGEGMSPADQKHLFESFYRSDMARKSGRPGTGMGLTLVKDIVDRHKGTIKVSSKVGVGSIFTVYLPK